MTKAPLTDQQFILAHVVDFAGLAATERFSDATPDLVQAILTEAARLADTAVAPVNRAGDLHPARLENGVLRSSPGYAEAYRAIAERPKLDAVLFVGDYIYEYGASTYPGLPGFPTGTVPPTEEGWPTVGVADAPVLPGLAPAR